MKNEYSDIYKIRTVLHAVAPDPVDDPLPPQPSILQGPSMAIHARATRKALRIAKNNSRVASHGINWIEQISRQLKSQSPASAIQGLSFQTHDKPSVSIVIPIYNKFSLTLQCLASIQKNISRKYSYEVIIVDNNSTDGSKALANVPGLIYQYNKENLGFVGGCNSGADRARGEYIVFLNNDASVEPNWLETLIATLETYPGAGLVGSKIIYPDGRLQEAGGIIYSDGTGNNYGKYDHPDRYQYNFVREVDYCSGASIILKKSLFDEFGGFDDLYAPAYYEDTDLAFKTRKKGLKVLYQPKSVIYHIEGATAGTSTTGGFKKYQAINHEKFLKRWKKELSTEHYTELDLFRARDRNAKKTVLIVDEHIPKPDEDSGSVRMMRIIEAYQALGYKVVFFPNFSKKQPKYMEPLQQMGVEVIYGEVRLADYLMAYGYYLDVVMMSRPRIGSFYMDLCKALCPNAKLIYDTVDLHYVRLRRQAEFETGDMKKYLLDMAKKHELLEKYLIKQADVGIVVSEAEVEILKNEKVTNVAVISNIHEVYRPAYEKSFEDRKDLLFVGGFAHHPNIDAIKWFVDDIFPLVIKKNDSLHLHVVGSNMPDDLRDYLKTKKNVIVDGFVEDLTPLLLSSRVFVAPLRYGAGVKGKIGQAIEYGIPIVSTRIGAEGMFLKHKESGLIADKAEAFADNIIELYSNKNLWNTLQKNQVGIIEQHFSAEMAKKQFKK